MTCLILTTGHDPQDGRLQRHLGVLHEAGISADLVALSATRARRLLTAPLWAAGRLIARRPTVVVFPDPELFTVGPAMARMLGIRAVIDVHEDYRLVALARTWIPRVLRRLVGAAAAANTAIGRRLAHAVVVADEALGRPGDAVVRNLPSPPDAEPHPAHPGPPFLVYVGDVTELRGATAMVELLALVPDKQLRIIGPANPALSQKLRDLARARGVADRLELLGRLPYRRSWEIASQATIGLALLEATPAYRRAVPSKVWEYLAHGIPVVASNLPRHAALLDGSGAGATVGSPAEAAELITKWTADPQTIRAMRERARRLFDEHAGRWNDRAELARAVTGRR